MPVHPRGLSGLLGLLGLLCIPAENMTTVITFPLKFKNNFIIVTCSNLELWIDSMTLITPNTHHAYIYITCKHTYIEHKLEQWHFISLTLRRLGYEGIITYINIYHKDPRQRDGKWWFRVDRYESIPVFEGLAVRRLGDSVNQPSSRVTHLMTQCLLQSIIIIKDLSVIHTSHITHQHISREREKEREKFRTLIYIK